MRRHPLAQMLIIGAIAAVIGIAIALSINWFPVQGSSQAKKVDDLYDVLLVASVPIFVLVEVVVLYSVWKFRMRPGEEEKDGPPIHGNTALEIIWTAIPALLIFGLCAYSYSVLTDIEHKPKREMVVNVTGQQFAWSYAYKEPGKPTVNTDTLYVPKGESVRFNIHSTDVIHDFWVPAFRIKIDAVPGITTHYRVTPVRKGAYAVVCAELCGLGHSTMRSTVHVVDPARFRGWLAAKQAAKPAGATS
jgi:cytochrome c oxidase subunit II